jgi:hypothetical protein
MLIYKFFNKPTKENLNDDNGLFECKLCEPAKFVKATIAVVTSNLIKHLKIYHESVYEKFQLEKVSNVSLLLISKLIYIFCLYLFFFVFVVPKPD